MNDSFRVVAIISAFNEGDIISPIIGHLVENKVDVYLIDNHSTDETVDQASRWFGRGLMHIESFPKVRPPDSKTPGPFDWTAILHRKEELASELRANWFIHHDADEVRENPWPGLTLKDAIRWVDERGYNCIDFRVFNFPPVDDGFKPVDDPRTYFTFYEGGAEFDKRQFKCWKAGKEPVSLISSGGHDASFEGRRIFPIPFVLRHYPIRGQSHGLRKVFAERKGRLLDREHSQGWHIQYDQIQDQSHTFLKNAAELRSFNLEQIRLDLMLPDDLLRDLADRLARAHAELLDLRSRQKGLERGLEDYKEHAGNLEREREELKERVANLERNQEGIRKHANGLEVLRRDLAQRNGALDQELTHIRSSRSWRWTAPLRRLFATFKTFGTYVR